jgi:hypothetical protein
MGVAYIMRKDGVAVEITAQRPNERKQEFHNHSLPLHK